MTRTLAALLLLLTLAACSGAAVVSAALAAGHPTPAPTTIATVEEAAARVIEIYPTFAGHRPERPEPDRRLLLVGGRRRPATGFTVTFEVGWGDCPAGCIDRHRWTYAVARDGAVTLLDDTGSPVPSGHAGLRRRPGAARTARRAAAGSSRAAPASRAGSLAGPTCPVVTVNDPSCDDRPLRRRDDHRPDRQRHGGRPADDRRGRQLRVLACRPARTRSSRSRSTGSCAARSRSRSSSATGSSPSTSRTTPASAERSERQEEPRPRRDAAQ